MIVVLKNQSMYSHPTFKVRHGAERRCLHRLVGLLHSLSITAKILFISFRTCS